MMVMVEVEVEVEVDVDEDDGCMENYLRQERPITDGLVDITAADEDTFNSFHFHIVAIHVAMDGRRKESSRRKRMLLVGSSCESAASNMVNPNSNSDHKLTFSQPYHYHTLFI
eukprot:scaffold4748_cov124-Skeletonema_dohrnii-CCMP3373.AAC.7